MPEYLLSFTEKLKDKDVMPRMTEEEAWKLAEQVEKNPPKVSGDGKSGFFMKNKGNIIVLSDFSATYLRACAEAARKTPSELVEEMIQERIRVSNR